MTLSFSNNEVITSCESERVDIVLFRTFATGAINFEVQWQV